MEEEVATCRTQVQQCQGELAGKEADNVSLYEKIRYLQRYSSNRQASSSNGLINVVQVDDAGVAQPKVEMIECNVMSSIIIITIIITTTTITTTTITIILIITVIYIVYQIHCVL